MTGTLIGMRIGDIMTESDQRPGGNAPTVGTMGNDRGSVYVMTKVAAGQNIINGNVVTWDSSYNISVLSSGAPAPGSANLANLAVAVISSTIAGTSTASASQLIWCQLFGAGSVRFTDTTASNLPNHLVVPGSTPGEVRGGLATASAYITGILLTATQSTAGLGSVFINFPRLVAG